MSALLYTPMAFIYERGDVVTPTRRRWASESPPPGNIYNTDHKGHPSRVQSHRPQSDAESETPPPRPYIIRKAD